MVAAYGLIAITTALLACGGGERECVATTVLVPGEGLLTTPEELDRSVCVPGSFASFDPTGTWAIYAQGNDGEGSYLRSLRITQTCEEGVEVSSSPGAYSHRSSNEDGVFWWTVNPSGTGFRYDAGTFCDVDSEGNMLGVLESCFRLADDTDCSSTLVEARPHGWPPGESEAEGLALVSELFGDNWTRALTSEVSVHDGVAYLARSEDGIRVIRVSDPDNPVEIAHVLAAGESINEAKAITTAMGEPFVLAASDATGLIVLDVSDPSAPTEVARYHPFSNPSWAIHTIHTETLDGTTYAYLADGFSEHVFVLDITDPTSPVEIGVAELGEPFAGTHAVFAEAGRAYVCAGFFGFIVVDLLPSPDTATPLGSYDSKGYAHQAWTGIAGGRHVAAFGNEGAGEPLEIIDVDPASPDFMTQIGEVPARPEVSIHDMVFIGEKVYATNYENGLRIYDLSDPTQPVQTAYFNTWDFDRGQEPRAGGALGLHVELEQNLIYVADNQRGLMILRLLP